MYVSQTKPVALPEGAARKVVSRVDQNRTYTRIRPYFWDFPAKNAVHTLYIYMVLANPTKVDMAMTHDFCLMDPAS
jgi:hypothetical protein